MNDPQQAGESPVSGDGVSGDIVFRKTNRQKESGRVLVVDDEPVICRVIGDMLARAGYEAITAPTGSHAVELFRQALVAGKGFDAAILDLTVCGGMGGEKTVRVLHAHDPALVAIALSGYEPTELPAWNAEGHFTDYLKKPFLYEELLQKVGDAMDRRKRRMTDANT